MLTETTETSDSTIGIENAGTHRGKFLLALINPRIILYLTQVHDIFAHDIMRAILLEFRIVSSKLLEP